MKAQILKIAGVKSEKEFYKKYPSEEAFMKVHSKEFKKAQMGAQLEKAQNGLIQGPEQAPSNNYYQNNNPFFTTNPGATGLNNPAVAAPQTGGGMAKAMPYMQAGMDVVQGLSMIKGQKNKVKEAKQNAGVTDVQAIAAESRDVDTRRQQQDYFGRKRNALMRPINGEELFPVDGVGTNVLARNGVMLQDGGGIGGNPTEIQNTYAPEYDLYDDLEYEPLNDSSQVKQFQFGGNMFATGMTSQQGNFSQYGDMASNLSNRFINQGGQEDAGSMIGGGIFEAAGTAIGGPLVGKLAKPVGKLVGGLIDTSDKKIAKYNKQTDRNIGRITGQAFSQNLQQQNQSYMEDGGYVNPEYNPQLITMFGDHNAQDFADYAHKDQYRAGGHLKSYTPPSERAMQTAQTGYTMTKSTNFIDARDTRTEYDPYLHKEVPVYTTPMEYKMGLQSATPNSSWYDPKESELGVVQMDNLRDYDMLTQESNDDYTFPIGDANERAATAAKYFDRSGKLSYTAGSADYKNITPDTEKTLARIHEGQTRKNGGPIKSYGLGGELETHWGGGAETISQNPYLPGEGETIMFRGKSHEERSPNGETGIGVTYGDSPVEVERGEPAIKLKDGTSGEENLTVYGNLRIPDQYVDILGDKNAKGKKFKNYIAEISKKENNQNKVINKSSKELDSLDVKNSFDKLKLTALQANIQGANMKLKDIADKKQKAAHLQNAINDTAEEQGLVADDLARGKYKIDKEAMFGQAKYGTSIPQAQKGIVVPKDKIQEYIKKGYTQDPKNPNRYVLKGTSKEVITKIPGSAAEIKKGTVGQKRTPRVTAAWLAASPEERKKMSARQDALWKQNPASKTTQDEVIKAAIPDSEKKDIITTPGDEVYTEDVDTEPIPYKRNMLIDAYNQVLPYIRKMPNEQLDPRQLYGEMYGLSNNQLEPVDAQFYHPQLDVPYDISLQDQRNEVTAQTRAAQRMAGYNPSAQAMIASQAYEPLNKITGEEFRLNQAKKDQVYSGNRATLNDAQLKNLAIADNQYQRQSQAKSNTKAITQAALQSIGDKYVQNSLENRKERINSNLYPQYSFDSEGRAINTGQLAQFNIPTVGSAKGTQTQVPVKDASGKVLYYQLEESPKQPELAISKNGKSIKAKNGSIVKSYKNI